MANFIKNIFFMLTLLISFFSCTSFQSNPLNQREPQSSADVIVDKIAKIESLSIQLNKNTCSNTLNSFFKANNFHKLTEEGLFKNADQNKIATESKDLIQKLFNAELNLRKLVETLDANNQECANQIRKSFRYIRTAIDYILEWRSLKELNVSPSNFLLHGEAGTQLLVNPDFVQQNASQTQLIDLKNPQRNVMDLLQPGDVILTRGGSYISAMISRISDFQSQFSHLSIIGLGPDGKKYWVEALIETGSIKTELSEFLKHLSEEPTNRAILFRHKNQTLAERAAKLAYNVVTNYQNSKKQAIPYDFEMKYDFTSKDLNNQNLFCSELVAYIYWLAGKEMNTEMLIPTFKNSFKEFKKDIGGGSFLKDFGITAEETFSPYDMEVEPHFQFVAEWRNINTISKLRAYDAMWASAFKWIHDLDYRIQVPPHDILTGKLGVGIMKRFPWIEKIVKKFFSQTQISDRTLSFVLYLQFNLADTLQDEASRILKEATQKNHVLTFADWMEAFEQFRLQDCNTYRDKQSGFTSTYTENASPFHVSFHANTPEKCPLKHISHIETSFR